MLQLQYIRDNKAEVISRLAVKNIDAQASVDRILELDSNRRRVQNELDNLLNEANIQAKQIGELMKTGKKAEADEMRSKSGAMKEGAKKLEETLRNLEEEQHKALVVLPNLPYKLVPKGKTPEENETVYSHGEIPALPENAVPHWDLITRYDLIDFELGVKITGAGFPVYKNKGARLQRALINFFLDKATAAGYMEIQPPILV